MTNDVAKVKESMVKSGKMWQAQIESMMGNKDKAAEILRRAFCEEALLERYATGLEPDFSKRVDSIIENYKRIYSKMGIDMPNFSEYKKWDNIPA